MKYMNVEFLRFIFSIMIVYYHLFIAIKDFVGDSEIYAVLTRNTSYAWIIVEFFLIIAGYFLYQAHMKRKDNWSSFALHKIARLWPVLFFGSAFWTILHFVFGVKINLYTQFINLFFLQCVGITFDYRGILWFISPFFWVMLLYFYVLKNWKQENANLFIAILLYLSFATYINNCFPDSISRMIRVFYGIGIGYFIGIFHSKITNYAEICKTRMQKIFKFIVVSAIEIYCFVFLINNCIFHRLSFNNVLIYVLVFSILFLLFLVKQGLLSKFLDNKFWGYCGRFSYSIYVMQIIIFLIFQQTLWKNQAFIFEHVYLNIFITLLSSVIMGILTYKFVEVPAGKFLKEKIFFRPKE